MLGGFLVWHELPNITEAIGMALIVGSGLFLFYRESRKGQRAAAESPLR